MYPSTLQHPYQPRWAWVRALSSLWKSGGIMYHFLADASKGWASRGQVFGRRGRLDLAEQVSVQVEKRKRFGYCS